MSLLKRWILISILSVVFIVSGTVLILFALGNKVNLKTFTIERTGGIYIASTPYDALISLDSRPVENKSGILNSGTLVNNLRSGTYNVAVSENGYYPWEKNIKVNPGLVSVYNSIVLVPKKGGTIINTGVPTSSLSSGVSQIDLAGKNLLVKTSDGKLYLEGKEINGSKIVEVSGNGAVITYSLLTDSYYLINPNKPHTPVNLSSEFDIDAAGVLSSNEQITKISFSSINGQYFLVKTNLGLYGLDLSRHSAYLISGRMTDYTSAGNQVYWINKNGINDYNVVFRVYGEIGALPDDKSGVASFISTPDGDEFFVLYNDGYLFAIVPGQPPQALSSNALSVYISTNGQDAFYTEPNGTIVEYPLPFGKPVTIKTGLKNISNISWYYDNAHLFVESGSALYFTEMDNTADLPLNIVQIAPNAKIYAYDYADNILYFTDGLLIKSLRI